MTELICGYRIGVAVASIAFVAGCASGPAMQTVRAVRESAGGWVVSGGDFQSVTSLLAGLESRVPNMEVIRDGSACARISLRNTEPIRAEPIVYLNGARLVDPCVLDAIGTDEVEKVTTFSAPMHPPGYLSGPGGLIIVDLRLR